jgi:SpoVK/Ycf46/Vps4 family AAA+-type ATPase
LRRPGRFDWQIHFPYPDRADREAILATSARPLHITDGLSHALIAEKTSGWSPTELVAIWSDAALLAVSEGRDLHVDSGGEHVRGGPVPQVVQPDGRQPGLADEELEQLGHVRGVQGAAVKLGEVPPR